ncbi:fasciclin domain-containing protein [Aequorivita marina]|uniref:fasciclin domain-containing protein n=1 Tax=Aequorivita marina TaxID=3073654 RepID=UPI002874A377|nr:fasciclin domain-containing protein [Aequorivita sp. S2608]MDS1299125.1 fasciclin domain-containing protein [Aequorivita sp. S2608]
MKYRTLVLSMAVIAMLFASCSDSKKKETEAQTEAAAMRMQRERDSLLKIEEEHRMKKANMEANSIAAKAMDNSDLSTLVGALQAADLTKTLKIEGEYTVFAPTNIAFEKLPKSNLDNLMKPENKKQLQNLLKYHVLQGNMNVSEVLVKIKDAGGKLDVTTLNGEILTLTEKNGKVIVKDGLGNSATVTKANMGASNGVIHTIDKVLMPKK